MPQPVSPKDRKIHLRFAASEIGVRKALKDVLNGLRFLKLSNEQLGRIELVLAEVLNNVVEHAYADHKNGRVDLQIVPSQGFLFCKVMDQGRPMPNGIMPSGKRAQLNCAMNDLPEGGFGWFLIRSLTQNLHYFRQGRENRLSFQIALPPSCAGK